MRVLLWNAYHGISGWWDRQALSVNYMNNPDAREADLKEIGRWKSDTMVRRYSKTGKRARAFDAFQRHNPLG
jgi:hypothetical protein